MKTLLIVIVFVLSMPAMVHAIPAPTQLLKDEMDVDHPDELNNPARKGSIVDQVRNSDQPVQNRTSGSAKLSREKARAQRALPTQNCDPNDQQCMRSQEINTGNPR